MILDALIVIGVASFLSLVVLGHVMLAGDLWRLWAPDKKSHEPNEAFRMPAE